MTKCFKTPKGTELPFENIKGKDYLKVPYRILWFREDHQDWLISCIMTRLDDDVCICRAEVFDDSGRLRAVGHKREDRNDFNDFMEKAETCAIGRALGFLGYGTQFAQDLFEDNIVDSPLTSAKESKIKPPIVNPIKEPVVKKNDTSNEADDLDTNSFDKFIPTTFRGLKDGF